MNCGDVRLECSGAKGDAIASLNHAHECRGQAHCRERFGVILRVAKAYTACHRDAEDS